MGTDGPYHNVIKIRPPMPFDAGNAARVADALDEVLLGAWRVSKIEV
jgi:4-aminobutyrate aminotransferase-like enzyme